MSAEVIDRVVLNSLGDQPTLYLESDGDSPRVCWMFIGHFEAFEIWITAPLSWDEADALVDTEQPIRMDHFLRDLSDRQITMAVRDTDETDFTAYEVTLPHGVFSSDWIKYLLGVVRKVEADDDDPSDTSTSPPATLEDFILTAA